MKWHVAPIAPVGEARAPQCESLCLRKVLYYSRRCGEMLCVY